MKKLAPIPSLTIVVALSVLVACRDTTSPAQPDLERPVSADVMASATRPIRAYVTNTLSNNVSVIDVATNAVVAKVPVGNNPLNVALTPDGAFAYVTNASDGTVSVINVSSNTVVATVGGLGPFPEGIAITPDGAFAYVANANFSGVGTVSVIATASNAVVATIEDVGGAPLEVAVARDGASVFVTNRLSNDVAVIDVATNTVETVIPVGAYPVGVAVRPDGGSTAYVVNEEAATISVIDVATREVTTTINLPAAAFAIAFSPPEPWSYGATAYVTIEEDPGSVAVIDVDSHTLTSTIPGLGRYPEGIAVTPDGATAYVANTSSSPGSVSVIDLEARSVLTTIEVGASPVWVAIARPNRAPIANAGEDQSIYLGDVVVLRSTASTDPDGDPIVERFWSIASKPEGSAVTTPDSYFRPDVVGDYIFTLQVSDGTALSPPDAVLIQVSPNRAPIANAGEDQSVYPGDRVYLQGTATDPDGDPIVYWYWNIESKPEGSAAGLPDIVHLPDVTFGADVVGDYLVSLVVGDDYGASEPDFVLITVLPTGSTQPGTDVEVAPPDETTGEASGVTITFDEVGGSGETTVSTSGAGTPPSQGFRLGQPPVYYEITTTATYSGSMEICIDYSGQEFANEQNLRLFHDSGNGWEDVTSSHDPENDVICGIVTTLSPFVIAQANTAPMASTGGPYTGDEGSAVALSFSGSDGDGDALTYAWDLGDGTTGAGATPPSARTYLDNGTYAITLTVSDAFGGTHTATTSATIANVVPSVGSVTAASEPVAVGTEVTVDAEFTDPGIHDSHTAGVDWGDGAVSPATVSETGGSGSVTDAHSYATAGVYTVKVSVTDNDGGTGESVYEFVVVYDPSGGFVTGGGWIYSAPEAFVADPSLEGKATFGFVSKYTKGAQQLTGATEFQFRAGNLSLHSTSYDWLVVTGSEYAHFKGAGTINGTGDYRFMVWAGDGSPDTFRIRIWQEDESTGTETVLYDNGFDQALGGGSIVVHAN